LDTRTKIINARELAGFEGIVVSGYFDPVTAAHAERLQELKEPGKELLVVVTEPPDPILPALARAQLVAGLRVVDHVAIDSAGAPPADVRLEQEDTERLRKLIAHVESRQRAAAS
jgi:glycerol-3-phosphate cytidylyltransferase-like family protein